MATTASDWEVPPRDYSFDTEGIAAADLETGGEVIDKEGWYHFEIADVVEDLEVLDKRGREKSPSIRFDLLVLETVPGQSPAGSRHFHRIYVASAGGRPPAEGSVKSALRFGVGLGILQIVDREGREVVVDPENGSTRISTAIWQRAKGRQFVAKIKCEKGDESKGHRDRFDIPFGKIYAVDDPAVAEVPKNRESLALIGKAPAATRGAAAPAKQAAAAAAVDDLSDL